MVRRPALAWFGLLCACAIAGCGKCPPNCEVFRGRQPNGKVVEMCARSNNFMRNGPYTEFSAGGKPELVGQYADNVKTGVWRAYDRAGRFAEAMCYANDGKVSWRDKRESEVAKRTCP